MSDARPSSGIWDSIPLSGSTHVNFTEKTHDSLSSLRSCLKAALIPADSSAHSLTPFSEPREVYIDSCSSQDIPVAPPSTPEPFLVQSSSPSASPGEDQPENVSAADNHTLLHQLVLERLRQEMQLL
ncbi:hypothetical protein NP233_g4026 [Leucocoprinus birnbaumii]|uniref:Uncharacterized protein n=1 Tax=Leucocoprinus birnbaumii TaxID=56174 RepID=A0AAD5YTC0_9AGAR|nr:hypothetical protein NP233_g4026 [Leucocoprinus birnbaumii]